MDFTELYKIIARSQIKPSILDTHINYGHTHTWWKSGQALVRSHITATWSPDYHCLANYHLDPSDNQLMTGSTGSSWVPDGPITVISDMSRRRIKYQYHHKPLRPAEPFAVTTGCAKAQPPQHTGGRRPSMPRKGNTPHGSEASLLHQFLCLVFGGAFKHLGGSGWRLHGHICVYRYQFVCMSLHICQCISKYRFVKIHSKRERERESHITMCKHTHLYIYIHTHT